MRLKTLEIKGFKSFADETSINFEQDVIGIVGPNGSGKSNVVDAIRWVLGEQKSSELRLDQMSNVIFNGTKKRKQGGMAQVTLTFSNTRNILPTEFSTVAITRRLYRSGESEYQLNGVACRLKDITNLFMDTGIGSNSYAIIALGMVDEILADKDNARRRMFEQAAGISKYKVRKRETLSRLQHTAEDLNRVEDLLFELGNNMKSMEQQAKRARRFLELKAEYRQLSLQLATLRSATLKQRYKEISTRLETSTDTYSGLEVIQRNLEAQLERVRKEQLDKESALSDRQRTVNLLVGQIRDGENDRKVLEQRKSFIQQSERKSADLIASNLEKQEALQAEINEFQETLGTEKRLESSLEDKLAAAESNLENIRATHGNIKAELDAIVQDQQRLEKELYGFEKQKAVNANQIENLHFERNLVEEEIRQRRQEVGTLQGRTEALSTEKTNLEQSLAALEEQAEVRRQEITALEEQYTAHQQELQGLHRQLDAHRNEYRLTKSMVESLEGFPESIRFLSNPKNWKQSAPLLSDLIYVAPAYRVAIENFLEPYLNYYVTEDLEQAKQAIGLLQSAQKGKANFFLLSAFRDYVPPIGLFPANTTPALDYVQCEPAYQNLIASLLEHVAIIGHEEPPQTADLSHLVLLSQSGQFIQRRTSLSGGSVGLFEGKKIGRKKNLELLEQAIRQSETKEQELSERLFETKDELNKRKALQSRKEIQLVQSQLNAIAQEQASFQARLESYESYLADSSARCAGIQQKIDRLNEENRAIEIHLQEKLQEAEAARHLISNTDGSYRQAAESLSQASTAFNEVNIAYVRQQNKVSGFQRELAFREKQLDENRAAVSAARKALQEAVEERSSLAGELASLEERLLEAYKRRKEEDAYLTEAEQAYFHVRGAGVELEDQVRAAARNTQELQLTINQLKDQFAEVKYQLSSLAERLRIEFGVSINEKDWLSSDPAVPEQVDEVELQGKVDRMKSRLDGYGDVNPMAVEAFDEMKQRHETISAQRDDILKAKEDLLETIKEIEETATLQFLEAFGKVRLYFIDVFRSLFTQDDAADLILLDAGNPLDSKIEIVAKPKGKRPQTISQLSGGEKTLTATALLFALYLLKPAPFCIFDEVDAPLDDANIEKFNRIIKEFSKESQFIIVTHNKQTMAAVDTIYGVYMAEQGVSALTQVDFSSLRHDLMPEDIHS
jgi:chromosome segregation protein